MCEGGGVFTFLDNPNCWKTYRVVLLHSQFKNFDPIKNSPFDTPISIKNTLKSFGMKLRQNIGSTDTKADIPGEQYSQNTEVSKMNKYSAKNSISKPRWDNAQASIYKGVTIQSIAQNGVVINKLVEYGAAGEIRG